MVCCALGVVAPCLNTAICRPLTLCGLNENSSYEVWPVLDYPDGLDSPARFDNDVTWTLNVKKVDFDGYSTSY